MQSPIIEAPIVESQWNGQVIESAPLEQPFDSAAGIESSSDINAAPPAPAEPPAPAAPLETPEPAAESDDLFNDTAAPQPDATPEATPEVAPAEPAAAAPAEEDVFAAPPSEPAAADEPMDDLFGEPPATEPPATEPPPAEEAPADDTSIDDLFGDNAPPKPADAATQPVIEQGSQATGEATAATAEPAGDDALADIFGQEPGVQSSAKAPIDAVEEAASDAEVTTPADDLDDLFGGADEAEPTAEPAASEPEASPAKSDSETDSDTIDDLFGETPSDEAPQEDADSIDDLFGAAPAADTDTVKSFQKLRVNPVSASSKASLQVVATERQQADPLSGTEVRVWVDNTGNYGTTGRLIELNRDSVRLLKSNGRTCTVPNWRLSKADAAYVDSIRRQLDESSLISMLAQ